jgi:anti-sigma-K factor RskA
MNLLEPRRLDALAREYALGTLHGGARRRFERLLAQSPAARMVVARWQGGFAELAAAVPPLQPRPAVWQSLQQRLGHGPAPAPAPKRPGWNWLGWAAPLASAALAVVLSVGLIKAFPDWAGLEPVREGLPPSYVGLLSDAQGKPGLLLSSRRHGRVLTAKLLQPLPPPAGQVAVLWAFPATAGDGAPFRVGTLPAQGSAALPLPQPAEKLFFKVNRLGVSFEPAGALPAQPGSALVWQGPCVKLW